ncbi:hypothetical protein [Leptospira weilii]|uniref:hypothetical protein n=1 Tax=Leptospira weilii TaxID=28184 RepID=UPI000773A2F5|nr:hypothetical protein [Leptospira weilii]
MESIGQKKKYDSSASVEPKQNNEPRLLSTVIRQKIKTELRYRYGSVAEWARINDLNYGYVTQVLNGIAPGHNIRALLEKEGVLNESAKEISNVL